MNAQSGCASWRSLIIAAALALAHTETLCNTSDALGSQGSSLPANEPPPSLRFDTPALHVGEICSGVPLVSQFAFTNVGPNAVELVEARPGCGCLKPQLENCLVAPGQRGSIPVEVKTLGQAAGPHTWQLTVICRDGGQLREQTLQVTATVVTEVSVQPAALTLFLHGELSHDITITDLRQAPLQILAVESTSPHLGVEAGPFEKDVFGHFTSKIHLQTIGDFAPGRHEEQLVIHTNDPLYREINIPLTVVK